MKTIATRLPWVVRFLAASVLMTVGANRLEAAAALVQSASAGSTNGQTSVSATFGSTPTAGNLLVAIVGVKAGDTIAGVSGVDPWNQIINQPGTTSPQRPGQAIFYKVAGGAESTTVTATTSPSTIGLQIFEYSGLDPVDPVDGRAANEGTGSQPANTGTVTPISGNTDDLLVAGVTINTYDNITAVSNGFTLRFNFISGFSGGRQTFGSADRFNSAADNNTTFSHGNNSWRAQIVAFKTSTACTGGLLLASGETLGYPPNGFTTRANNDVSYTFANSQAAANEYAIFETHDPWGGTVVKTAITGAGHTFSVFTPAQLAGFTFSDYRVVVLNWDDTFTSDFLAAYTAAIPALEAYINGGGVVWVQASIQGSPGDSYPLPFGGTGTIDFQSQNFIVDTAHPLVAGVPNPINGNFASHAHLTGMPGAAHVIIVTGADASGNPTLYTFTPCP